MKEKFAIVAADVQIECARGIILISSEEGETGARFKQMTSFRTMSLINVLHSEDLRKDVEFEVVGDAPRNSGPKQAEDAAKSITNGSDDGAQPSTSTVQD